MVLFIMLVAGFVLWELTPEWVAAEHTFLAVPSWGTARLPPLWLALLVFRLNSIRFVVAAVVDGVVWLR